MSLTCWSQCVPPCQGRTELDQRCKSILTARSTLCLCEESSWRNSLQEVACTPSYASHCTPAYIVCTNLITNNSRYFTQDCHPPSTQLITLASTQLNPAAFSPQLRGCNVIGCVGGDWRYYNCDNCDMTINMLGVEQQISVLVLSGVTLCQLGSLTTTTLTSHGRGWRDSAH